MFMRLVVVGYLKFFGETFSESPDPDQFPTEFQPKTPSDQFPTDSQPKTPSDQFPTDFQPKLPSDHFPTEFQPKTPSGQEPQYPESRTSPRKHILISFMVDTHCRDIMEIKQMSL